ncbi:class I SAM-dependent methyltransferase [Lutibaculum baratangense]|uniref:Methyltransferase n=1 Tax=Lutibaculum baratangense AMV1 TaxID=631454 RepID=V4RCK4_9HYPH|nr:class I SAM-dependent methyltransferase [Lutibaculum baratangense]ESR23129.1 Methyltransferase [Lutibaculum baratangense AMV1]
MSSGGNSDQWEYWNASGGRIWGDQARDLDALLEAVTRIILQVAAPRPGEHVLDIGCGAGASTLALARAVGSRGRVVGVDLSSQLLGHAERRRRAAGLDHVAFEIADAQTHPFEPEAFDLLASRFGVMFFSDPVSAFRNLATALRPAGRVAFAAWAGGDENPWFSIPQRIAEDRLGKVEPSPPLAPGPLAFRDIDQVVGLLEAAGLAECRGEAVPVDLHHPGGLEAVVDLTTKVGPTSRLMREKGGTEADLAAMRERIRSSFARYDSADGFRIPAVVNMFQARRP